jgi:very-short-patch-repair endonuclease
MEGIKKDRPPLRSASPTTSPPLDGGEERRAQSMPSALPLPPQGGEVASRSDDGVGEGVHESRSRRKPGTTLRARGLRQGDNQAEALLWLELKRRRLGGHKFTRQYPIGPYFADFACRDKWLVVEVDGSQHADSTYDRRRDKYMRAQGYSVLRFWSHEIPKQRRAVCETILAALTGDMAEDIVAGDLRFVYGPGSRTDRPPLRSASPTTSPPFDGGEEGRERSRPGALPLPPPGGGEVASRSDDGVGEPPFNPHFRDSGRINTDPSS